MNYRRGDLIKAALTGEVDIVVHGCNCFNTMGAGIAKIIRETWPSVYQADLHTCKGDRDKLGRISTFFDEQSQTLIINAYTQFTYWDPQDMLSYEAIRNCMKEVKKLSKGKCIGLPKIGAGLARGDWNRIEKIIEEELGTENVYIYVL